MTTSNGHMPRSFGLLLVLLGLLMAREVIHALVGQQLMAAIAAQRELGHTEQAIVAADNWVLRWYPFALVPVFLAPAASAVAWAIRSRWRTDAPAASFAPLHLRVWLVTLAVSVGLLAVTALLWNTSWATTIGLTALAGFSWANAGALFAALRLQERRNANGLSRVPAGVLAVVGFLLGWSPLSIGALIPLWVVWVSRGDLKEQQAG